MSLTEKQKEIAIKCYHANGMAAPLGHDAIFAMFDNFLSNVRNEQEAAGEAGVMPGDAGAGSVAIRVFGNSPVTITPTGGDGREPTD